MAAAGPRTSMTSATEWSATQRPTRSLISSPCWRREAAPRKFGLSASSGRPIAVTRRRKMRFVATAITTQPSRAR